MKYEFFTFFKRGNLSFAVHHQNSSSGSSEEPRSPRSPEALGAPDHELQLAPPPMTIYGPDPQRGFPSGLGSFFYQTFLRKQARKPRSYASLKLRLTDRLTYLLTDEGKV